MPATILIVEDHDMLRRMLEDWLGAELPGRRFVEASNGGQAVEMVRDAAPDLVLMDIVLPGMSGLEATRRIKTVAPDVPVVVLTGYEDVYLANKTETAGASAFVVKRNLCSTLESVVEGLLAQKLQKAIPAAEVVWEPTPSSRGHESR